MQQQQQIQSGPDQVKMALGVVHFVCRSMATTMEVFLHKGRSFGERYLGLQAIAALLVGFFYTAFWRGEDVRPVIGFLVMYLIACVTTRWAVMRRVLAGGQQVHSFYTGTPRIMRLVGGRLSEETVKRIVEPAMVFTLGLLVIQLNEPLGTFFMLAAFALFASVNLAAGFDRTRAMDMNDLWLDQCNLVERFREMRG